MADESVEKNLEVEEEEYKTLGKFGRMRRTYLKEHKPALYNQMLRAGELQDHLWEVNDTAREMLKYMMAEMLKRDPAPDKATNPMGWVGHMNSLQASAEEVILAELVYN